MNRKFKLDGEAIDIFEFLIDNSDTFTKKDILQVLSLNVGDRIVYGGGAAPEFVLVRTK